MHYTAEESHAARVNASLPVLEVAGMFFSSIDTARAKGARKLFSPGRFKSFIGKAFHGPCRGTK